MIPFLDLQAQYRAIKSEIDPAVLRVMDSGQFVLGEEVARFEEDFARYCGTRHAVALNSGTSALHLALLAAGIGPGDEVVTVPMTFVATAAAILYTGATPVFVDIDPLSWTMDPAGVEAALTERTKAILPVHLHGQMAKMDAILAIAREHGLLVVEDAAQAHGAERAGRRAGSLGDMGCFSFYPGKNLGAYGEGGALVTNRPDLADTARMLRDWGQTAKYQHSLRGYNYRMEALQGAILTVKLRYLDAWTEARRARAARYDALLAGSGLQTPSAGGATRHVYHVYAVRVADRDGTQRRLAALGIATGIHYPIPIHLQPAFRDLGYGPGDFPVSEWLAAGTLSLPLFPELTDEQVEQVCRALWEARNVAAA